MAIQFHCAGCNNPIEVDDDYAGRTAACPYCNKVVTVPQTSTLDPDAPVVARPAAGAAGPSAPPLPAAQTLHVGPAGTLAEEAAATYGNYGLICAALAVVLIGAAFVSLATALIPEFSQVPQSQPSREWMMEILTSNPPPTWVPAAMLGASFFSIVGLALSITSLRRCRRKNWRGFIGTAVCASLSGCCALEVLANILTAPL